MVVRWIWGRFEEMVVFFCLGWSVFCLGVIVRLVVFEFVVVE